MPLGVDPNAAFDVEETILSDGDTLFLFTDGLIEARVGGALFGLESVKQIIGEVVGEPLDTVLDKLLAAARSFGGGRLRDDVALVGIRFGDR